MHFRHRHRSRFVTGDATFPLPTDDTETPVRRRVNFVIAEPWKRAGCKSISEFTALYANDYRKPGMGHGPAAKDRGATAVVTGKFVISDY